MKEKKWQSVLFWRGFSS